MIQSGFGAGRCSAQPMMTACAENWDVVEAGNDRKDRRAKRRAHSGTPSLRSRVRQGRFSVQGSSAENRAIVPPRRNHPVFGTFGNMNQLKDSHACDRCCYSPFWQASLDAFMPKPRPPRLARPPL
jgi:hypothetical protein